MNFSPLALLIALSFTFINPCDHKGKQALLSSQDDNAISVTITTPELSPQPVQYSVTGQVETFKPTTLTSHAEIQISHLLVKEGDFVTQGDPVASLSTEAMEENIEILKHKLNEATSAYNFVTKRIQETDVAQRPTMAETEFLDEVPEVQSVPESYGDANTPSAPESYKDWQLALEARTLRLKAELQELEAVQSTLMLDANATGMVQKIYITDGSSLKATQPILDIMSVDPMLVTFDLTREDASYVDRSSKVEITTHDTPEVKAEGTISEINPNLDTALQKLLLRASIPNPQGQFKGGQTVTVSGQTRRSLFKPTLPLTALTKNANNETGVFTIYNGTAKWITLQHSDYISQGRDTFSVLSGVILAEDPIITNPPQGLKHGDRVKVITASSPQVVSQ